MTGNRLGCVRRGGRTRYEVPRYAEPRNVALHVRAALGTGLRTVYRLSGSDTSPTAAARQATRTCRRLLRLGAVRNHSLLGPSGTSTSSPGKQDLDRESIERVIDHTTKMATLAAREMSASETAQAYPRAGIEHSKLPRAR